MWTDNVKSLNTNPRRTVDPNHLIQDLTVGLDRVMTTSDDDDSGDPDRGRHHGTTD